MNKKLAIDALSKYPKTDIWNNWHSYSMTYDSGSMKWICRYKDWEDSQSEFRYFEGNCSYKIDSCVANLQGKGYSYAEIKIIANSIADIYCTLYKKVSSCKWHANNNDACSKCGYKVEVSDC